MDDYNCTADVNCEIELSFEQRLEAMVWQIHRSISEGTVLLEDDYMEVVAEPREILRLAGRGLVTGLPLAVRRGMITAVIQYAEEDYVLRGPVWRTMETVFSYMADDKVDGDPVELMFTVFDDIEAEILDMPGDFRFTSRAFTILNQLCICIYNNVRSLDQLVGIADRMSGLLGTCVENGPREDCPLQEDAFYRIVDLHAFHGKLANAIRGRSQGLNNWHRLALYRHWTGEEPAYLYDLMRAFELQGTDGYRVRVGTTQAATRDRLVDSFVDGYLACVLDADGNPLDLGPGYDDAPVESISNMYLDDPRMTTVIMHTTMGDIKIRMHDDMPITTGNFIKLAKEGFYNDVIFHRVIDGFMIQGGDPQGTGMGGPGYTIQDEFGEGHSNVRGTISMANTGRPNTGGSQFFINTVDNTYLDKENRSTPYAHPVFGTVLEGMDVVDKIGRVETDRNDRPLTDVVIKTIDVIEE